MMYIPLSENATVETFPRSTFLIILAQFGIYCLINGSGSCSHNVGCNRGLELIQKKAIVRLKAYRCFLPSYNE